MADQRLIARSLLHRLPEEERSKAVVEAINSLKLDQNSFASSSFAVSLLAEHPSDEARSHLLDHLVRYVEHGRSDLVISLCAHDASLKTELLGRLVSALKDAAAQAFDYHAEDTVGKFSTEIMPGDSVSSAPLSNGAEPIATKNVLLFTKCAAAVGSSEETKQTLLNAILSFLTSSNESICTTARIVLVSFFSNESVVRSTDARLIWTSVKKLISDQKESFHSNIGFDIWLRWVANRSSSLHLWFEPLYWQLLRDGLKCNDSERRKQCLGILRQSIVVAASKEEFRYMVCSETVSQKQANVISAQYDRFLTIFETIILGRYYNQILACEDDLNLLASSASLVQSKWLFTLLEAGFTPKMQESNKKFLGNWIMQSNIHPDEPHEFIQFFKQSFLPWATQGSLFTSSIQKFDGELRSMHGDKLASYIRQLLQKANLDIETKNDLVEALLDLLTNKRRGNFPYASVFVLDGLSRAFESTPELRIDPEQLEQIIKLSSWTSLPEVSRDFIYLRCLKLCADISNQSPDMVKNSSISDPRTQWQNILQTCRALPGNSPIEFGEPVASWGKNSFSSRDVQEKETAEKIREIRNKLDSVDSIPTLKENFCTLLQDVFDDLVYLEYPRRVLIDFVSLALEPRLVHFAVRDEALSAAIGDIVANLQGLYAFKAFLFTPVVTAIRRVVLSTPEAVEKLFLESTIVDLTKRLPEPTLDLQLEDLTTHMIQSISPEMRVFDYRYYFGDRASVGHAALLDLVSRLYENHPHLVWKILNNLKDRWVNQKVPPPIVTTWKSTVQLQVMLLCCEQVVPSTDPSQIAELLDSVHYILSIEPLPRYRYLLGWMLARIYLTPTADKQRILKQLRSTDHHSNPKYMAALLKIAVVLARVDGVSRQFAKSVASVCFPLAASSKIIIRHEAQWQIPILMDHAKENGWIELVEDSSFVALNEYIRSREKFDDPPLERKLDQLDPIGDNTLTVLADGKWFGLDNIESPLCTREDFIELYRRDESAFDSSHPITSSCLTLGEPVSKPNSSEKSNESNSSNQAATASATTSTNETRALQTKGKAYLANALDAAEDSDSKARLRNNDLIVVGSLVDNPYNLGGLSRVSEIFGAGELHIQNKNVMSSKDFINVAVSSHVHLPIQPLSLTALPSFLAAKRDDEGYTIVGIEQTDRSVLLGAKECVLPRKVVLVVGSEKEGIPADVLGECGMLVEIPQVGVTRSLNVQTAVGIVLFEYARQHRGEVKA
ncbi:Hypothetical protein R9X50_00500200 [Acrodontium crateriforme]|uniref:tRNA/rRNA methyltransferase SpoU type domain-containing protein n=1 Tax=Acrodontium crateriforme TaxID=150365 RepID=A0AAQ3MC14_9PEZI|nr:Hypothetical protein R9X50_00500200 [Acrodontium crateriforme]